MRRRFAVLLVLLGSYLGCQSAPENLREWRPSDHDHTTEPGNDQVAVQPDGGSAPELAALGLDEVSLVAWQQNCVRCHGVIGRGDGPQGPPLKATDLTDAAWQRSVKDEQIARTIREGRGLMPPFALPDSTVAGLVRLIRLLDISRARHGHDAGAVPSGEPMPSAGPPASAASVPPAPLKAPSPKPAPPPSAASAP